MTHQKQNTHSFRTLLRALLPAGSVVLGAVILGLLAACQSFSTKAFTSAGGSYPADGAAPPAAGKSGAQLWAEHCGRCHNVRDPAAYSDAQWDAAMMHMRIRANLTGQDYEKIREFILSAN